MSVYLHDIPLSKAQARLREALQAADLWRVLDVETIPLDEIRFIGYAFQIEMKFLTFKYGFKIKEAYPEPYQQRLQRRWTERSAGRKRRCI